MLEEHYSVVFDAVEQNSTLDGILLYSGFIAEDIGYEKVEAFISRCRKTPMVSIAMSFPGITSLLTDNKLGIYDIVTHLIQTHSASTIAFVKGPEDHEEASERFAGYCTALADAGLSFDESLVLPGHFSIWSGEEAVQELYDVRNRVVDVIVCADDETAVGVIKELTRRGISVPHDVAVCGFDDAEYSEIITPSLSTVRQPFYEMGREAVDQLIRQMREKSDPEQIVMATKPVIRQSCGCVMAIPQSSVQRSANDSLISIMHKHIKQDFGAVELSTADLNRWADSICKSLGIEFKSEHFLKIVDQILIDYRARSHDLSPWKVWFSHLLMELRHGQIRIEEYADRSEAILQAVQLVDSAETRNRRYIANKNSEDQWEVRGIAQSLGTSFNIKALSERLRSGTEDLGINTAMVFLYNEPCLYEKWVAPQFVTYVFGFNESGNIREDMHGLSLPMREIRDLVHVEQKRNRCTLFYMPLFFGDEQIGIMMMQYNPNNTIDIYEPLRLNVSTALKGAALFEKIERQSVTDELTQLYNRRGFITFSMSRFAHLRRAATSSALFFIDMDGLKAINDTYGHKEGDRSITICAQILKDTLREGDIIGRMGGDEFTVFTSSINEIQSIEITRRLRSAFDEFNKTTTLPYRVDCSIGSYALHDYSEESFESSLQKADELLYQEKCEKRKRGIGRG